jgi:hypothetical protein
MPANRVASCASYLRHPATEQLKARSCLLSAASRFLGCSRDVSGKTSNHNWDWSALNVFTLVLLSAAAAMNVKSRCHLYVAVPFSSSLARKML